MDKPEQLPMLDLPSVEPVAPACGGAPKAPAAPKPRAKRARQMSLDVRLYKVRSASSDWEVQAASRSAAKYAAFKLARASGQYLYDGGFLAFVAGSVSVKELRR